MMTEKFVLQAKEEWQSDFRDHLAFDHLDSAREYIENYKHELRYNSLLRHFNFRIVKRVLSEEILDEHDFTNELYLK